MTTVIKLSDGSEWTLVPHQCTGNMWMAATHNVFASDQYWTDMLSVAPSLPTEAKAELAERLAETICDARNKWFSQDLEFDVDDPDDYVARAVIAELFGVKP